MAIYMVFCEPPNINIDGLLDVIFYGRHVQLLLIAKSF
jgi:hypothetical protein